MAQRTSIDTGPRPEGGQSDYGVSSAALTEYGFGTFVRFIKNGRVAQIEQLKTEFDKHMRRLRLRVKGTGPVKGMPAGSDQLDLGTMIGWASKVQRPDTEAKAQLVLLVATINVRLE